MTIAKWCVLIACFLPSVTAMLPKISSLRLSFKDGKYDNNNPREWESKLIGWQKRAIAAHSNGYEALPLFIAAVIFAQMALGDQGRIDMLAITFVALRGVYSCVPDKFRQLTLADLDCGCGYQCRSIFNVTMQRYKNRIADSA